MNIYSIDYGSRHSRTPSSTSQASSPGITVPPHEQHPILHNTVNTSPSKSLKNDDQRSLTLQVKTAPPRPPPPKYVYLIDITYLLQSLIHFCFFTEM